MKTDNIYIGELVYLLEVNNKGTLRDYLIGDGILRKIKYQPIKYVVVKKINFDYAIDLKTNKKYLCEHTFEVGTLYLPPEKMILFDAMYPSAPKNLSKRKILKMGNAAINEIIKKENEEK